VPEEAGMSSDLLASIDEITIRSGHPTVAQVEVSLSGPIHIKETLQILNVQTIEQAEQLACLYFWGLGQIMSEAKTTDAQFHPIDTVIKSSKGCPGVATVTFLFNDLVYKTSFDVEVTGAASLQDARSKAYDLLAKHGPTLVNDHRDRAMAFKITPSNDKYDPWLRHAIRTLKRLGLV
jgi:hypothetical protein